MNFLRDFLKEMNFTVRVTAIKLPFAISVLVQQNPRFTFL